ncbi:MAG: aminoglycoside phosphotransferase family protein [Verrucomicrobiaceae bacterium]|nr:aminoglycoside phosphotransferase family protein [Verrucomicrobiaceae bacterium]
MSTDDYLSRLVSVGLLKPGETAAVQPLSGGVSSDIVRVTTTSVDLVIKAALPKLKVRDDWFADVGRNKVEQAYLEFAATIVPESVPQVIATGEDWFAMEYLGNELRVWKSELMNGTWDVAIAEQAGEVLGRLHAASWCHRELAGRFATDDNFHSLRIEPYLLKTAERVPEVAAILQAEARRLSETKVALVHGDFSPKNLLVNRERLVVLDAECAWYGDPAFDTAFLLTHLFLKALLHSETAKLVESFWNSYHAQVTEDTSERTVLLVLCLMLARVHGKSPVEYLDARQQGIITEFCLAHLPKPPQNIAALLHLYENHLAGRSSDF